MIQLDERKLWPTQSQIGELQGNGIYETHIVERRLTVPGKMSKLTNKAVPTEVAQSGMPPNDLCLRLRENVEADNQYIKAEALR